MPRRKVGSKLTFTEVTPALTPEERAGRIEIFIDTMAKAAGVKGYAGCKYFPDQERGEIYLARSKADGAAF